MTTKKMTRQEEHDFSADPANQTPQGPPGAAPRNCPSSSPFGSRPRPSPTSAPPPTLTSVLQACDTER